MAETTSLTLAVDSRQVRSAAGELDRLAASGKNSEQAAARVSQAFGRLNGLLGGIGAGLAAREIIQAADAYNNLNAKLRLATNGSAEFATAQSALFNIAQSTRVGLEQTNDLFTKLATSTEALGVSQRDVLGVTETINQALLVSGGNAQSAAAALVQLGQGFSSGTLRGEELNSVLEQAPRLARAIADGLGVPIGALRKLGEAGELTGEKVFRALQKSADQIGREFASLPTTVGQSLTQVQNAFLKLVGVIDETSGASSSLAGLITDVATGIGTLADEIKRVSAGEQSVSILAEAFVLVRETVQVLAAEIAFVFGAIGREIGAVAAQIVALGKLDIDGFNAISAAVKEDAERARRELDKFTQEVLTRAPRPEPEAVAKPPPIKGGPDQTKAKKVADPFGDAIKRLREEIALIGKKTELEQIEARIALGTFGKLSQAQQQRIKGLATELDLRKELQAREDASLQIDLAGIQRQLNGLTSAYGAAEAILEAQRQAGIVGERDYFEARRQFIALNEAAQVEAVSAEIERLKAQKAFGDEAIRNQEQIADKEAELLRLRADAAAQTTVLGIQERAAFDAIAAGIRAAKDSLESYLQTLINAQQREVEGLGLGNRERDRRNGRSQIEDNFEKQRRDLQRARRDAEFAGTFGAEQKNRFNQELALINEFQAKALASFDTYYAQRLEKEAQFNVGVSESFANYIAEAENTAKQVEQLFDRALGGVEDSLVDLVTTGKTNFRDLVNSLAADIARIGIKQAIGSILSQVPGLGGVIGGAAQGAGNAAVTAAITTTSAAEITAFTTAIATSEATATAAITAAIATSTTAITSAIAAQGASESLGSVADVDGLDALASAFGGFFANGGDPPLGKVSVVGENGPELFVPRGRGTIVPLQPARSSEPAQTVQQINVTVQGQANQSRETLMQQGRVIGEGIQRAIARNG